jgi:GH15 family glucan-1,4-alpha-glucosidase
LKKIAAILLLLLLAFNWYGYKIVLAAMQDKADRKLEALLDNSEYDESQLIEIRVTMNMPYQQRFTEYERTYGEVDIDGKTYTYVKRKVEGDVVVLKCIANTSKQQLKKIDNDFTKANTGIDTDHPGKQQQQSSFAKNFWSEYDGQTDFNPLIKYTSLNKSALTAYSFYIPEIKRDTPHQPPEC